MSIHTVLTKEHNNLVEKVDRILLKRIKELPESDWNRLGNDVKDRLHKFKTLSHLRHEISIEDKLELLGFIVIYTL